MEENLMFVNDMTFYDNITDDDFIETILSFQISEL
jgi:hypothetical protein